MQLEYAVIGIWMLITLALLLVSVFRRAPRPPGAFSRPPIAGGSVDPLLPVHEQFSEVMASIDEVKAMILNRPVGALPLGFAPPKPHRHRFKFASEEKTNKVIRRIHVCEEADCPDAWIVEEPEPMIPPKLDA